MMPDDDRRKAVARRGFLVGVAASTIALVGLTAGQAFDILAPFNLFAPRVKGAGPQDLPVNRTARQADVTDIALDPGWRLTFDSSATSMSFTRDDLERMPQHEAVLPIACVEGWSTTATWRGVRLGELLDATGVRHGSTVRFDSMQRQGAFRSTTMPPAYTHDPLTLVALEVNGQTLDVDHGYPARIIAPGRPGVLQTKWLTTITELVS